MGLPEAGLAYCKDLDACPKKKSGLRSFEYHCAHSYWTFRQVLISVLGNKGKTLSEEVLEDVRRDLGQTFVETLQKYKDTDFNVA